MKIVMNPLMPEQFRVFRNLIVGAGIGQVEIDVKNIECKFQAFLKDFEGICEDLFPGIKNYKDEHIAEQIFHRERERKDLKEWAKYELVAAKRLFEWSRDLIKANAVDPQITSLVEVEMKFLKDVFTELMVLIEEAYFYVRAESAKFGGWKKRNVIHSDEIFFASRMLSKEMIIEKERGHFAIRPTSIFLIRQAIEIRIKNGLGIDIITEKSGKLVKLPVEVLLQILEKVQKNNPQSIDFPIKISILKKIIKWSNYYIHGGFSPFLWDIVWAQHILKPLFSRGSYKKWHSRYGAIKITKGCYDSIDKMIKKLMNRKDIVVHRQAHPEAIIME